MVSANINSMNVYQFGGMKNIQAAHFSAKNASVNDGNNRVANTQPAFRGEAYNTTEIRTSLTTKDEKKKYNELSSVLNYDYRKKLEYALKSGILLKNGSDDKSSVLDNLYKILKTERDKGLDAETIVKESLDIISNPFVITQTCEDIPNDYKRSVLGIITNLSEDKEVLQQANYELDNMHTGTCPTASVEFDLATKNPAEFFRMVEGLTSPNNEVYKTIDAKNLSEKTMDTLWLLNKFKTPYEMNDFDKIKILLKPDKNAIIRARIQNNNRDKGERSIIDVLMQSTMMQLGSQQTYDSLTDKRSPNEWTQDDGGLIDFEKTYVESIMENKNTTSVVYQEVDVNGRLVGHTEDYEHIKKDIIDTLKMGRNVIIGYTWANPDNGNRLDGHEITIVGTKQGKNGELMFVCQDSDDNLDKPIELPESFLIPAIHHAGLPDEIASREANYRDSWEVGMDEFEEIKKEEKEQQ